MKNRIVRSYGNGNSFMDFILFSEETNENIDYEQLNNWIDFYFDKRVIHENVSEIISCLGTIYRELKETKLLFHMAVLDSFSKYINVVYIDGKLENYSYLENGKDVKSKKLNFSFNYSRESGVNFFTSALPTLADYEEAKSLIDYHMDQLKKLEDRKIITLNRDDILLCEVYRLFYSSNPNFTEKDINLKIQTMMKILGEFGITVNDYSDFAIYSNADFPTSLKLDYQVNRLIPFGEIALIETPILLAEETKKMIETVRQIVGEIVLCSPEKLAKMSRILHEKENQVLSNASTSEITNTIQLVKEISTNL